MKVQGRQTRTIWLEPDGASVGIIDQTRLPHEFVTLELASLEQAAHAIRAMLVRGAPLIGATAAYGVALALTADPSDASLARAVAVLAETRPTAINLRWALDRSRRHLVEVAPAGRAAAAWAFAALIADEDVGINAAIGRHGLDLVKRARKGDGTHLSRT